MFCSKGVNKECTCKVGEAVQTGANVGHFRDILVGMCSKFLQEHCERGAIAIHNELSDT